MNQKEDTPLKGSPDIRSSLNAILFGLLASPILLISFRYYFSAVIAVVIAYFVNHYAKLAKYNLKHVPRVRVSLYVDWPISYLIMFAASFLSESWNFFVFICVLLYQLILANYLWKKAIKSYHSRA